MEIIHILMGYGPILISGAVLGGIISFLGPELINKLKINFKHQRVMDMHREYVKNQPLFTQKHPELAAFFDRAGWQNCECANCRWLHKKTKKQHKSVTS